MFDEYSEAERTWERGIFPRLWRGLCVSKRTHMEEEVSCREHRCTNRQAEGKGRKKTCAILDLEYHRRYGDAPQLASEWQ
jgi:hypothetical protein